MSGNTVLDVRLTEKAQKITERELETYRSRTKASQRSNQRAWSLLPSGVPSSFQYYDPHPVVAARAAGSRLWDVDGNEYVDFNMGYGALFSGHSHPKVADALHKQIANGTLFVTPCDLNADVAELLCERFGMELIRFTNSGTEATHDAIRAARAFTGRDKIVKVEGGYHGHHDEVMVSMKRFRSRQQREFRRACSTKSLSFPTTTVRHSNLLFLAVTLPRSSLNRPWRTLESARRSLAICSRCARSPSVTELSLFLMRSRRVLPLVTVELPATLACNPI
jgi:4-aminobutyrate aminotransferase-like enzyme